MAKFTQNISPTVMLQEISRKRSHKCQGMGEGEWLGAKMILVVNMQ